MLTGLRYGSRPTIAIMVLAAMLFLANTVMAAEKLETVFWNLDWSASDVQIKENMEQQQFVFTGQGRDDDGRWLLFDQGLFMGQTTQVKVRWNGEDPKVLQSLAIRFSARGADTDEVLRMTTENLQAHYGAPVSRATYWMKSNPPIRVESVLWRVRDALGDPYDITLSRTGTELTVGETPVDSEVRLMVERELAVRDLAVKGTWSDRFLAPKIMGPGTEGAAGAVAVGVTPTLQYERVGSLSYVYLFEAQEHYQTLAEQLGQQARPVLVARVEEDTFTVPAGVLLPGRSYRWYVESIYAPGSKSEAIKNSAVLYFRS